jgi:phytoene synthase
MSAPPSEAEQITRASKSNLALAFIALSPERRRDICTFYAFCRTIDDIADDPGRSLDERQRCLDQWKTGLETRTGNEPALAEPVRALLSKYRIPVSHLLEIIAGCEMDLAGVSFHTWEDLRQYCHRVASVVGLVSIEIFGYRDPGCHQYALDLGLALQLTNILRDVGQDYASNGRVYLPLEEMDHFGYPVSSLASARHDSAFLGLMNFQADRAIGLYQSAQKALPAIDRRNMVAAEIMRTVYRRLLTDMQRSQFRVFQKRYRLNTLEKALCIGRVLVSTALS